MEGIKLIELYFTDRNSNQQPNPAYRNHLEFFLFLSGLVKIKEATDIEEKLNEVERLLKNAINMPCKVGISSDGMSYRLIKASYMSTSALYSNLFL